MVYFEDFSISGLFGVYSEGVGVGLYWWMDGSKGGYFVVCGRINGFGDGEFGFEKGSERGVGVYGIWKWR